MWVDIRWADIIWEVEYTDEFGSWFDTLTEEDQDALIARVDTLASSGPTLGRPVVDTVALSRHSNMKELRGERAVRVLFAFDPRRTAILLIGGDKGPDDPASPNWNRWYDRFVPIADDLFDTHLAALRREGLI